MKYTKIGNVKDPSGNRSEDAGLDFYVSEDFNNGKPYIIRIGEQVNIPSCIKVKVPQGMMMLYENKSGIARKKGLVRLACVVDTGYRGICNLNLGKVVKGTEDIRVRRKGILGWLGFKEWAAVIQPGEKIIQGILVKISTEEIQEVSNKEYEKGPKTKRGQGAFGSTGTK